MGKSIKQLFKDLVLDYGEYDAWEKMDELETFDYCSEHGVSLADSTIDKIAINGEEIRFYYNENTGDYDTIDKFKSEELMAFYKDLAKVIGESRLDKRGEIRDYINAIFSRIIVDNTDRNRFAEAIVDDVIEDVRTSADITCWTMSDVDIAIARKLLELA